MNYFFVRQSCPACKSLKYKTLYSCRFKDEPIKKFLEDFYNPQGGVEFQYLEEGEFILDECLDCGLVYQRQIPDDFLTGKLYSQWIDPAKSFDIDVNLKGLENSIDYAQEILMLLAYFEAQPGDLKFLDFGMGWGGWARMAKAFGCDSYGVELSQEKADYAGAHCIKLLTYGKIRNYRFDVINLREVLEHVPNPLEILSYLKGSLKNGGLIRITLPNGSDIKRKLKVLDWSAPKGSRNSLNPVSPLEHINCFEHKTLIKLAALAGLEPVKIPIRIQYAYRINRRPVFPQLKNLLKPLYDNLIKRNSTSLFFKIVA